MISSERFFVEEGIDIHKQEITVVGIVESGDVFGNGMMESEKFKLFLVQFLKRDFYRPKSRCKNCIRRREKDFLNQEMVVGQTMIYL